MSRDLAVVRLERQATEGRGHRQYYTMGADPLEVGGIQSLAQLVSIGLMSKPGSHVLDQAYGVGMRDVLRAGRRLEDVRADVIVAVSRLRDQILRRQASESMPDDERLSDLKVARVFQDGEVYVIHIGIVSAAGSTLTINSQDFYV